MNKCCFLQSSIDYLGHHIDAEGVHPTKSKVEALLEAPAPTNVAELQAFLGFVQYYGRFYRNLSTILSPMNALLRKNVVWKWTNECQAAYETCKHGISEGSWLTHYDVGKQIRLACDASSYGIGAVISHVMDDDSERPIAMASRTLTKAERGYAQLEKEGLSLIFGVKKFHMYLYGKSFTLITDHLPIVKILGPKTGIPALAADRMQRWSLILSAYYYTIEYRKSADHANADGLSRLPDVLAKPGNEVYDMPINLMSFAN